MVDAKQARSWQIFVSPLHSPTHNKTVRERGTFDSVWLFHSSPHHLKNQDCHSLPKANLQTPPAFDFGGIGTLSGRMYLRQNRNHLNKYIMETQLVYAEIIDSISDEMRQDPLVQLISDGSIFFVTTIENAKHYDLEFHPVCEEAREAYCIRLENGKLLHD